MPELKKKLYPQRKVTDTVLIKTKQEVENKDLSEITHNDKDKGVKLNGILIQGYEMKFGKPNANGEKYAPTAFDKWIKEYFIDKGLNMPVNLMHSPRVEDLVGRVIYAEVNTVGLLITVYIPKSCDRYDAILWRLKEGLLQGFSKEGWATDWEPVYNAQTRKWEYDLVKEMQLTAIALVDTPANGQRFNAKETKNALAYRNELGPEPEPEKTKNGLLQKLGLNSK